MIRITHEKINASELNPGDLFSLQAPVPQPEDFQTFAYGYMHVRTDAPLDEEAQGEATVWRYTIHKGVA